MHFWSEKNITKNIACYFGSIYRFRIGIIIGLENAIYLGWFVLGLDIDV